MQLLYFGSSLFAVLAFSFFLLPIGYLAGLCSNAANFRARAWYEQVLWSVVLSAPLAVLTSVFAGRILANARLGAVFLMLAAATLVVVLARARRTKRKVHVPRPVFYGFLAMALLGLYIVLATVPVVAGESLYESVASGDWSVRVPLVDMAIQHGLPLINPFDHVDGQTYPLRYYYYWYVLAGVVGATFHLPARAVLTADAVWSAWALVATMFLLLRTLFLPTPLQHSIKKLCLLAIPVGCIIGLDILAMAVFLSLDRPIVFPDLDWWRSSSDFSMSFHTAILFAPHHVAGLCAALLAFLLLLPPHEVGLLPEDAVETLGQRAARTLLAALCFATAVGTSSYMALFIATAALFVLVERLRSGDRAIAYSLVGAGLLALLASLPFFLLLAHTAHHEEHSLGGFPVRVYPHSWSLTKDLVWMYRGYNHLPHPSRWAEFAVRFPLYPVLCVMEAGFFGFIVWTRARDDWRARKTLSRRHFYQWALFLGIFFPGCFLNSAAIAGANDLGRHAGFALRVLTTLWAVPIVAKYLNDRKYRQSVHTSGAGRFALIAVLLGFSSQMYQMLSQRFFLYVADTHLGSAIQRPFPAVFGESRYYRDLFRVHSYLAQPTAPRGYLLYSPLSDMDSAMMIYQTRGPVAPERYCMTAFGGDYTRCAAAIHPLFSLFGATFPNTPDAAWRPPQVAAMSLPAMESICRRHKAGVVLAVDTDNAWNYLDSFVWKAPLLYSTPRMRLLACPDSGN